MLTLQRNLEGLTARRCTDPSVTALIIGIAVLGCTFASTVRADPERLSTKVSVADLDLVSRSGMHVARLRLTAVAKRLCTQLHQVLPRGDYWDCFDGRGKDAWADVHTFRRPRQG